MKCPVCNAELPSTAKFCGGCGTTLTAAPPSPPQPSYEQPRPVMNSGSGWGAPTMPSVEKKYKMLRFIAVLIKIFAFVAAGILVIVGLFMIISGAAASSRSTSLGTTSVDMGPAAFLGGAVGGLIMIIYAVFVFVFLYAYSEWMYVFMDIEENTRVTNEMLLGRR